MRKRPLLLALETVLRATSLAILAVLFVMLLARGASGGFSTEVRVATWASVDTARQALEAT